MTAPTNPPIPRDVYEDVHALYSRNSVGCCLHIVLDDGNVDESSVSFCERYAEKRGHDFCLQLRAVKVVLRDNAL